MSDTRPLLIQTRTLCKFLMEVALLDARFLRARPSMIAAIGMYLARKMLGGEWVSCLVHPLHLALRLTDVLVEQDEAFMFYSGFTELQLAQPAMMLTESLLDPDFVNTCESASRSGTTVRAFTELCDLCNTVISKKYSTKKRAFSL